MKQLSKTITVLSACASLGCMWASPAESKPMPGMTRPPATFAPPRPPGPFAMPNPGGAGQFGQPAPGGNPPTVGQPGQSPGQAGVADARESIRVGGLNRTYTIHLPSSTPAGKSLPAILVFHGSYGSGDQMKSLTGFNQTADRLGFVVVYPDGVKGKWNDGEETAATADDVGFVDNLINKLIKERRVDRQRVYVCGYSNGGALSQRLAYERSDLIAGFGSVCAGITEQRVKRAAPGKIMPVIFILGTQDKYCPWNGGTAPGGRILVSANQLVNYWIKQNGCASQPLVWMLPDKDTSDRCRVKAQIYNGNARFAFYSVLDGGHTWPVKAGGGLLGTAMTAALGNWNHDVNASDLIADFFIAR